MPDTSGPEGMHPGDETTAPDAPKLPPPVMPGFSDHVFKVAEGVRLPLRVWVAEGARDAPWLLWFHGGGFVGGKWTTPHAWIPPAFTSRGYHVVSVGYRLLPEAGAVDQLGDAVDAAAWGRANLGALTGGRVDVDRLVVGGDSSGCLLAAQLGHVLSPAPRAVLDLYGVVDLLDPVWFARPADGDDSAPGAYLLASGKEGAAQRAQRRDASDAAVQCPWAHEIPPAIPLEVARAQLGDPEFVPDDRLRERIDTATYMYADAQLCPALFRRERIGDDAFWAQARKYSPLHMLDDRESYPPTYFMHGTEDTCVPIKESRDMADKLRLMGVPVAEDYPELGHVFDTWTSPEDPGWKRHVVPCLDWIDRHVKS